MDGCQLDSTKEKEKTKTKTKRERKRKRKRKRKRTIEDKPVAMTDDGWVPVGQRKGKKKNIHYILTPSEE